MQLFEAERIQTEFFQLIQRLRYRHGLQVVADFHDALIGLRRENILAPLHKHSGVAENVEEILQLLLHIGVVGELDAQLLHVVNQLEQQLLYPGQRRVDRVQLRRHRLQCRFRRGKVAPAVGHHLAARFQLRLGGLQLRLGVPNLLFKTAADFRRTQRRALLAQGLQRRDDGADHVPVGVAVAVLRGAFHPDADIGKGSLQLLAVEGVFQHHDIRRHRHHIGEVIGRVEDAGDKEFGFR